MSRQVRCNRCQVETTARWLNVQTQERWDGHTGRDSSRFPRPYVEGIRRRDLCQSCAAEFERFMAGPAELLLRERTPR